MPRVVHMDQIKDNNYRTAAIADPADWGGMLPDGEYHAVDDAGCLRVKLTYRLGVVCGLYMDYWPDGLVATTGTYQNGLHHGTWVYYDENGEANETIVFDMGRQVSRVRHSDPDFDVLKPY